MRKPPKVTETEMRAALASIRHRHRDDDNTSTHLLDSEDPRDVLAYLRRRGAAGLLDGDVTAALTVRIWLWWEGERVEVWLLEQAEARGLNRKQTGAPLGITTGWGLVLRLTYKRGLIADEAAVAARTNPQLTRAQWLADHRDEILRIARTLVEHRGLLSEETAEELSTIRADVREGRCTPAFFADLSWSVDAVADALASDVAVDHPLRCALADWPALAAAYPPPDSR
jgi:hypothetical protein